MSSRSRLLTSDGPLSFTIAHRPRVTRRMHLELDEDGGLVVVVPRDWPGFYTRRLLKKHLPQVRRFLSQARRRQVPPLRYAHGGVHLYQGGRITLELTQVSGRTEPPVLLGNRLQLALRDTGEDKVRLALQRFYQREARALFAQRLEQLRVAAPWTRGRELTLALRRMKRTWGTCNREGVLRINTHLIKAPVRLLDYVLAHELCHLAEMNHGPDFYRLQTRLWPAWREDRRALRENAPRYLQE